MENANGARPRLRWLDGWRGLAVIVMVFWHLGWDLGMFGLYPTGRMRVGVPEAVRYWIVCSFVIIAGISARMSRNLYRRAGLTLLCALAVTVVTYLAGDPAWYGILHLLGSALLIYALAGKWLERLPEKAALALWLTAFFVLLLISNRVRVETPGLWIFGLRTRTFSSSDYYPLFPWLFLFLAGTVAGGRVRNSRRDIPVPAWLLWIGRHALWIYLIHQPVLLGTIWLIRKGQGL